MAPKSGIAAQIGIASESTPGTGVTVTRFYPLNSEKVDQKIDRMESKGIIAGRRVLDANGWAVGNKTVAGQVQLDLWNRTQGLLWKHMMGGAGITGAGPYTQTYTPGDMSGLSFTMQIGRPDVAGTVQPFTYAGCKVAKWTLGAQVGQIATLNLDVVGMSETTATALASASYSASATPLTFVHGALTIAGSAFLTKSIQLNGDNGLAADRRFLGQSTTSEPLEADLRKYGGQLQAEFNDLTAYARFTGGTTAALVLTFTSGSDTLTITTNVRFDGETPNVSGRKVLDGPLKFECIGTTDAAAITVVTVNSDAAA